MTLKRLILALVVATCMLAFAASSAFATLGSYQKGRFQVGGVATEKWVTTSDSPSDPNSRALQITTPSPDGVSYAAFFSTASTHKVLTVQNQYNLSFEFAEANPDFVDQRISVQFQNGDVAYLDVRYCNNLIAVSGGTWGRADFTGQDAINGASCGFYVTGATGGFYAATATQSAWDVYAAANPNQVVVQRYLVVDFGPGTYLFDRISLGVGKMYTQGNFTAQACTTEASC
jgi:hypothetical protein